MNYDQLFNNLDQYVQMRTWEEMKGFELTVQEITKDHDPSILRKLIDYFDDDCDHYEVMYTLLHAIEDYPHEVYIRAIIGKFSDNITRYQGWFERIILRILNHAECYELLKNNLKDIDKQKAVNFFNILDIDTEKHKFQIDQIKKILNESHFAF